MFIWHSNNRLDFSGENGRYPVFPACFDVDNLGFKAIIGVIFQWLEQPARPRFYRMARLDEGMIMGKDRPAAGRYACHPVRLRSVLGD